MKKLIASFLFCLLLACPLLAQSIPFPGPGGVSGTLTCTQVSGGTGSNIGNQTAFSGLAACFDGNTNQTQAQGCGIGSTTSGFNNTVGKDYTSTVTVCRVQAYSANNSAFRGDNTNATYQWESSSDCSSFSTFSSGSTPSGSSAVIDTASLSTANRCFRFNLNGNGANSSAIAEIVFWTLQ